MSTLRTRRARAAAAVVAAAGVSAGLLLAADGGPWGAPDPATVDLGAGAGRIVDGAWTATHIEAGAAVEVTDPGAVALHLDTASATLRGTAGCNLLLGSFTLTADGRASFTVPSARTARCPAPDTAREEALLAALAGTRSWLSVDGRLELRGPRVAVVLVRS